MEQTKKKKKKISDLEDKTRKITQSKQQTIDRGEEAGKRKRASEACRTVTKDL